MAVVPHTVDLVVRDLVRSLAFYRTLGSAVPGGSAAEAQIQVPTPGARRSAS
jgi:hypothetical protein